MTPELTLEPLTVELAAELSDTGQPGVTLPADAETWAAAAVPGLAFVGRAFGRTIGAGGIMPSHKPRATAWLIVEPVLPARLWVQIRRELELKIAEAHAMGFRRLEAHIHENYAAGWRFIERLGFTLEGYCPCWLPDHSGVFQYARFDPPLDAQSDKWLRVMNGETDVAA